jgi:acetyl-CoA carboxylase biotin carboxyl carrier protein
MNQKEIKELIELLVEKDITEFELERGDVKVHVKRGGSAAPVMQVTPVAAVQPVAVAATPATPSAAAAAPPPPAESSAPAAPAAEAASDADLYIVKSPIVGTFYEAPSPGTPPFVKVGDTVKEGQVLCIIEAMKLMNEIDSECDGEIVNVYLESGQPVQYGERLFAIRTR